MKTAITFSVYADIFQANLIRFHRLPVHATLFHTEDRLCGIVIRVLGC
jgi:hypothetical protein